MRVQRSSLDYFAHHPTNCKVKKAENKEGEYKDDEEDEIKLAECG